jgi:hypothetical protein
MQKLWPSEIFGKQANLESLYSVDVSMLTCGSTTGCHVSCIFGTFRGPCGPVKMCHMASVWMPHGSMEVTGPYKMLMWQYDADTIGDVSTDWVA